MEDYLKELEKFCLIVKDKKIDNLHKISSTSVKGLQKSSEDFDSFCSLLLTLPKNVILKKSSINENQYGIWSNMEIPKGVRFGPYSNILVKDDNETDSKMLDVENDLNWLCHINFASCQEQQNLISLLYDGEIYYETIRDVRPDTELLVWYEDNNWTRNGRDDNNGAFNSSASHANENCKVQIKSEAQQRNNSFSASSEQRDTDKNEMVSVHNEESNTSMTVNGGENLQLQSEVKKCICDKRFENNSELEEHLRSCTVHKRNSEVKSIPKKRKKRILKSRFPCDICDRKFKKKIYFIEHRRLHTGEKPYICDFCGKKSARESSHKLHLAIHTAEKQKVCNICEKKFLRNSELRQHEFVHTAIKSHVCDFCGKSFKSILELKLHRRRHTQEQQYVCDKCGKQFYIKICLKQHLLIHTGEKPYICEICRKRFLQKGSLYTHIRIHTGENTYICEACGIRLSSKSSLKCHMFKHNGEKPYVCDLCGKRFARKSYLKLVHSLVHKREKS